MDARNPQKEAQQVLSEDGEDGLVARVLEPSPPANTDPDWFADDPVALDDRPGVSPTSAGTTTWSAYCQKHPHRSLWAEDRWLGPWRRLEALPDTFAETRQALHQFAFFVLAPRRHRANGKIGLRYTLGGFGTPFFEHDEQVRIDGTELVRQSGETAESIVLTSVGESVRFIGGEYRQVWFPDFRDQLHPAPPEEPLPVDGSSARAVADWFGFCVSILEELRHKSRERNPRRPQLWPEHFDLAIELDLGGERSSIGGSPGDAAHSEPYLYVTGNDSVSRSDPRWNDEHFFGASLPYRDLVDAPDQRATALAFYRDSLKP
jgi:hypothetical protein